MSMEISDGKQVVILGETWTIGMGTEEVYPALADADGYADTSMRRIVIATPPAGDPLAKADQDAYSKQILRHEIIHAFLYESGLEGNTLAFDGWAHNEEMIDWFAIQSPKIIKVFMHLGLV